MRFFFTNHACGFLKAVRWAIFFGVLWSAMPSTAVADVSLLWGALDRPIVDRWLRNCDESGLSGEWPVAGVLTSMMGPRYHPILHRLKMHRGIDIAGHRNDPVRAISDGWVLIVGSGDGLGRHVVIDHPFGWQSVYGHLETVWVDAGRWVSKGEVIGRMGDSGLATGVHLHFELKYQKIAVDPLSFLAADHRL